MLVWNRRGRNCCLETRETCGVAAVALAAAAVAAAGMALEREGRRDNWLAFVAAAWLACSSVVGTN